MPGHLTLAIALVVAVIAACVAALFWANARYQRRKVERLERQRDRARLAIEQIAAIIDETGDIQLFNKADRIVDAMWSER